MDEKIVKASHDYIIEAIRKNAIYTPTTNKYMFGKAVGARYSMQYYMANCLYDTKFLEAISHCFYSHYLNTFDQIGFQIAGREWSAIPIITALLVHGKGIYNRNVNGFMIRRKAKNYGRHNLIEGLPNDKEVLFVDDLCNSTDSFLHCYGVCEMQGLVPYNEHFAIFNKYSRKRFGDDIIFDRYARIPIYSICERDDL